MALNELLTHTVILSHHDSIPFVSLTTYGRVLAVQLQPVPRGVGPEVRPPGGRPDQRRPARGARAARGRAAPAHIPDARAGLPAGLAARRPTAALQHLRPPRAGAR